MELIKQHIKLYQEDFINSLNIENFNEVYESISGRNKEEIASILKQLFRLIDLSILANFISLLNFLKAFKLLLFL